ncbi:hypothetical protein BJX76DRAFT_251397 [Aspergillus varians]
MEHLHSHLPYAQWRLQILRRLFLPSGLSNSTFLSRRVHSSHNCTQADPNTSTPRNDNETRTDGNNNVDSIIPPSQLLPQSPLIMNPHPGRALRHRKKSRPTPADLSDLSKNPWAMALATPVRMCNVTGTRMPSALLTEWGLVEQPVSGTDSDQDDTFLQGDQNKNSKLWLLPVGLLKDDLVDPAKDRRGPVSARPQLQLRILDRMPNIQTITDSARRSRRSKHSPLAPIVPQRWKPPLGPMTAADESRLFWRLNMPDFVLRTTRQNALRRLKRASDSVGRRTAYKTWLSFDVQEPYSGEALLEGVIKEGQARQEEFDQTQDGIFFIFGEGSGSDVGATAGDFAALPETITLPGIDRKYPVFDLTQLFSQVELGEIRAHHPRFQKPAAFLRPRNELTVDAVLALWNLQGYIREPKT